MPQDRLRAALSFAGWAPVLPGWRVGRGLRLVAPDCGWAHGRGPEVRGTGEALLMALAGRRSAVVELEGPGRALVGQRLGLQE